MPVVTAGTPGIQSQCHVMHTVLSPEAAMGGTIALVEDGDEIEIDIPARVLKVNVSDEVLAQRKAKWQPPVQNLTGYLKRYAQHVTSGAKGAVFED